MNIQPTPSAHPKRRAAHLLAAVAAAFVLAACQSQRGQRIEDIPTLASIDAINTAQPLTQNAPPPPYDAVQTAFSRIDAGLNRLPGWRYEVQLEFTGTYSDTPLAVAGTARAQVWFNQVSSARRVVFETSGALFGADAAPQTSATAAGPLLGGAGAVGATSTPAPTGQTSEAVRLGPDAFLVRGPGGLCSQGGAAETAADLSAGDLVGGAAALIPAGRQTTLNGQPAFAYRFEPAELRTPMLRTADGGTITVESAEVWLAPAHGVIVRYYANLAVERAVLLGSETPVTGTLLLRYDLYDIGEPYNITVPFGC